MRQASILIAALFCLALVAQLSAPADEAKDAKDAAKDKSSEWMDGSVWEGIAKVRYPDGSVRSAAVTLEITKRDGKSFEGNWSLEGKARVYFEGEVGASGDIKMTFTKLVGKEEWLTKGSGRNLVGVKGTGTVEGNSVNLKAVQPDPDHPKDARIIRTYKLKLKEDK